MSKGKKNTPTPEANAEANSASASATVAQAPKVKTATFNYPERTDGPKPAPGHTLRGMAIELLHGGATLDQMVKATEAWYTARGSFPRTSVYARAVELVRLVNKANGYGLSQDPKSGVITIVG